MSARRAAGRFLLLAVCLFALFVPAFAAESTAFTTEWGDVTVQESTVSRTGGLFDTRSYAYPDGARLTMARFRTTAAAPAQEVSKLTLEGRTGTLRRYDADKGAWTTLAIQPGTYPAGTYHLSAGQGSAILVTPQAYADRANGMIEHLPACDGKLVITATETGFRFTLMTPAMPANVHAEWLLVRADSRLVNWSKAESLEKWAIYRFTGENRWCMNGYYYLAPSSYYPSGANYYNNLPAAYIAGRMMRDDGQPASVYLGLAMLDVMSGLRNADGYLPSLAGSEWLRDDYGIGPGYFDTRFNVDLAVAQLNAVERYGVESWRDDLVRFGEFLMEYAADHHFSFNRGSSVGWLVQDYAHKQGGSPTHCSLNHQAAEAVFLYRLADLTGESRFAEAAETLTRGVEYSAVYWVKGDGNLHYSYAADGTFGSSDYPYLTYNDLLELQQYVIDWRGQPSVELQTLLTSKRAWMDRQGITEYNK